MHATTVDAPSEHVPPGVVIRARGVRAVAAAMGDIKLAHSVFALPFALLGAVLAFVNTSEAWGARQVALAALLVLVCMVSARTWAMLINRLADYRIDARNPRTQRRAIASGRLGVGAGWAMAAASAVVFAAGCAGFVALRGNPWPVALAPAVLLWIAFYSYSKRFTWLCHVLLGSALAISPLCAAVAVDPTVFGLAPTHLEVGLGVLGVAGLGMSLLLLAGFVLAWVAGFDVAYALQDLEFDRAAGLRSVPAAFGVGGALWIARLLHAGAFACLVGFALLAPGLGVLTLAATAAVGAVLVYEHVVLTRRGVAGLPLAFFTLNGVIAVLLGGLSVADAIIRAAG